MIPIFDNAINTPRQQQCYFTFNTDVNIEHHSAPLIRAFHSVVFQLKSVSTGNILFHYMVGCRHRDKCCNILSIQIYAITGLSDTIQCYGGKTQNVCFCSLTIGERKQANFKCFRKEMDTSESILSVYLL